MFEGRGLARREERVGLAPEGIGFASPSSKIGLLLLLAAARVVIKRVDRLERVRVQRRPRPGGQGALLLRGLLEGLVPSPFSIEGGKIEAKGVLHTVLGGS